MIGVEEMGGNINKNGKGMKLIVSTTLWDQKSPIAEG